MTALIIPEGALLPEQVSAQVQLIQHLMKEVMKDGEHYGVIPGCGTKPALLKPGAEKLCFVFQLVPNFESKRTDYDRGHREYEVRCRLTNRAGVLIAEGLGTCSTYESKYRYRTADRVCPACGKPALMKSKRDPEFYCWTKKDGCGATFALDDKRVTEQQAGKVENPDPADQWNTVLKMATKRAHVAATITACAASDLFTQDIEENAELAKAETTEAPQGNGHAPRQQDAPAATPTPPKSASPATEPTAAEKRESKQRFDEARETLAKAGKVDPQYATAEEQKAITAAYKRVEVATGRDIALGIIKKVSGDHVERPKDVPREKVAELLDRLRLRAAYERAVASTSREEADECVEVVADVTGIDLVTGPKIHPLLAALEQLAGIEQEA